MKKKIALCLLTSSMLMSQAQALPTIYPKNTTYLSTIFNTTNSNLVADDTDMRVIYVMPPNSARSIVKGLHTINANVGFCKEMASLQKSSANIISKMDALTEEELNAKKANDEIRKKIAEANEDLADYVTLAKLDEIMALDLRLTAIEERISDFTAKAESCSSACEEINREIYTLQKERNEVSKSRRAKASERAKEIKDYEKKKAKVAAYQQELIDQEDSWSKLSSRLMKIRGDFHAMYGSFAQMEGARAGILFESNWDQNIDDLRAANPQFDFKKISTQNAVITTNIADLSNIPTGGAILGYDIAGKYDAGALKLPAYPDTMSGNVRLSLLGACPMLHPQDFDITVPTNVEGMNYGMTVSYEYPTAFLLEATAEYNMYKMYQKIVKSKTKGGFFSSKKTTSIEERNFFRDEFKVTWEEQDQANSMTDEQKADVERDMRNNIFGRLAAIGLPAVANAGQLVLPQPDKTGAVVLSDSLKKTCPGNAYCVGAAIALDVLQAVFGSSTATTNYTNIQDAQLKERFSSKKVIYKPWITTYN